MYVGNHFLLDFTEFPLIFVCYTKAQKINRVYEKLGFGASQGVRSSADSFVIVGDFFESKSVKCVDSMKKSRALL
jgi:hypothetical protein